MMSALVHLLILPLILFASIVNGRTLVKPLPADHVLRIVVGLPIRNATGLHQEIADIHNKSHPRYGQYGNPQLFLERYGPTSNHVEQVSSYLKNHSLTIRAVSKTNVILTVEGKVQSMQSAFQMNLNLYQSETVPLFFDTDFEPILPVGVLGVVGFHNHTKLSRIGGRAAMTRQLVMSDDEDKKAKRRAKKKKKKKKTSYPTKRPSSSPTLFFTPQPTASPLVTPTASPSVTPTASPSVTPTASIAPTSQPPSTPTVLTSTPTIATLTPTSSPTASPTNPTQGPTQPTISPTGLPKMKPPSLYRFSSIAPQDFLAAYSFGTDYTGTGQIGGLYELDSYYSSDISEYTSTFNLPNVPLVNACLNGVGCPSPGSGMDEVTLDIDLMIAAAPGLASLYVYQAPNTLSDGLLLLDQIGTDNIARVVSCSWGIPEDQGTASFFSMENTAFATMAFNGQSFFAASGDFGAFGDGTNVGVQDPSSQPYVTGVGGTTLYVTPAGQYASETTWWDNSASNGGSGGGISSYVLLPNYQKLSGVVTATNSASSKYRNVPDVSLNAEPSRGYLIYLGHEKPPGWYLVGGTSCASPIWAGFALTVNQALVANSLPELGNFNLKLYPIALYSGKYSSCFNDIDDGSTNGYIYRAVQGYDLCTGWGSMQAESLLQAFVAAE